MASLPVSEESHETSFHFSILQIGNDRMCHSAQAVWSFFVFKVTYVRWKNRENGENYMMSIIISTVHLVLLQKLSEEGYYGQDL